MRSPLLYTSVLLVACGPPAQPVDSDEPGGTFSAVTFNVESGDAFRDTIAESVEEVEPTPLWGFQELASKDWLDAVAAAAERGDDDYAMDTIWGSTGSSDHLGIVYDTNTFALVDTEELHHINVGDSARSPLVAHLEHLDSGLEFKFMVNHLWRTDDDNRHTQASLLNAWGDEESLPVVALGDYNFDWEVEGGDEDHDEGYDRLVEDDVWVWVRPETLIKTQCSNSYESVLDFVFVAQEAKGWDNESEILFPDASDCRDTQYTSDHRPVSGTFTF